MDTEGGIRFSNDASVEVIVSFNAGQVTSRDFISVNSGYRSGDKEYIRGEVELEQIARWANEEAVSVLLVEGAEVRALGVEKKELVEVG